MHFYSSEGISLDFSDCGYSFPTSFLEFNDNIEIYLYLCKYAYPIIVLKHYDSNQYLNEENLFVVSSSSSIYSAFLKVRVSTSCCILIVASYIT